MFNNFSTFPVLSTVSFPDNVYVDLLKFSKIRHVCSDNHKNFEFFARKSFYCDLGPQRHSSISIRGP